MSRIKVADRRDQRLIDTVCERGHGHVFRWWGELSEAEKRSLLAQLRSFDFDEIDQLAQRCVPASDEAAFAGKLSPAEVIPVPSTDEERLRCKEALEAGEARLAAGAVCAFTVAGGQGTRLGFDGPKGAFSITPVKGKSLFELFAGRIQATERRYGKTVQWFIMVSDTNREATQLFFEVNGYFGLFPRQVHLFCQRMIPALSPGGRLILDERHHVFTNPNGHGGSLLALSDSGALKRMETEGVEQIFYFQVDNVLCRVLDPVFIGFHELAGARMSTKVVRKTDPAEKVGLIGYVAGRLGCIEYSDISKEEASRRNRDGSLVFSAGNIAIHMLRVDFVRSLTAARFALPYHKAWKKIPYLDDDGRLVQPAEPNGLKFETFVFDALAFAESSVTMEVVREDEFAPLKNAEGTGSPATARAALTELYARWLEAAGVRVPRGESGTSRFPIEISPLFALDEHELAGKMDGNLLIEGPTYLE